MVCVGGTDEAMQVLKDMMVKGIAPNVFTYSTLMDGFCKAGHLLELMVQKLLTPT